MDGRQALAGRRGVEAKMTPRRSLRRNLQRRTYVSGLIPPAFKENAMNLADLNKVAEAMVAPGRGILAADESTGTIKKRFDTLGVECTADSRRDYREMLFRSTDAMTK